MEKERLAEGSISGGLHMQEQLYKMNYLPKEGELEDKIEISIISPWDKNITKALQLIRAGQVSEGLKILDEKISSDKMAYHSLRFNNPEQLKIWIEKLISAYAYFLKMRGRINIHSVRMIPSLFQKELVSRLKQHWG